MLATSEDLTLTCDGALLSRILYKRLLTVGERVAIFVEHGPGTSARVNIGQESLLHLPAASEADGGSAAPVPWGRACDPYSACPYEPFPRAPETAEEVASHLIRITERNVGRLGSTVDSGTPVQHTFAKSDQMSIAEDGTVVNNIRENSWARVDCEITVGVSVEFSFEVLDDRENDEGTCYGLSTAECTKYDSRGSFVLRGYSGHLYCDGSDKGEKFPKIHPRNRVTFRFDYSEGRLEAWLDDQEPRMLINDPGLFAGRTLYPTVFNYHGTRTKVKLLRCSSGLRSRAALQDCGARGMGGGYTYLPGLGGSVIVERAIGSGRSETEHRCAGWERSYSLLDSFSVKDTICNAPSLARALRGTPHPAQKGLLRPGGDGAGRGALYNIVYIFVIV